MARLRHSSGSGAGILSRQGELFSGGPPEGFLQKFHPGSRMVLLLVLLGGISLCRNYIVMAGFFVLAMATALGSFLNIVSIYRVMLVPLLLLAFPSWLVAVVWYKIEFVSGTHFFLRTLASISVSGVILHSIGLRRMGDVLVWLRLPLELRQSWTMMVSQVAGFSDLLNEMTLARHSRRVQPGRGGLIRRQIGRQMGILFARTYQRGNQLGLAMESRRIVTRNEVAAEATTEGWAGRDFNLVLFGALLALMAAVI